ncbi:MAG TPA: hypothetical protein VK425_02635 [Acidimicrobiales bacterium]|nr:hypothetical protein [Acidimicrobiales bacterium]
MRIATHQGNKRKAARRSTALLGVAAVFASAAVVAGLAVTAGPAYADITSAYYTIGSPTGAVTNVVAAPASITEGDSTNFEVSFTIGNALSGLSSDWVSLTLNGATLGSAPANVDTVGSSCLQTTTNGGADTDTLLTIVLNSSCSMGAGTNVQVDFTAVAPTSVGSFTFGVTTSRNTTSASSNIVTVNASGATLTAEFYGPGANTTYTITGITVLSTGTTVILIAQLIGGSGTISFLNSPNGSGYSVTYTPSGGSATNDPVTSATAAGAEVTLTLADTVTAGGTLAITATGTNPSTTGTENNISVEGETTNAISFGGSVGALSVSPSSSVAGADTTYTIYFQAADAVNPGGTITLSESAGPTNFATVTGIEVIDNTQNWHFVAAGPFLSSGIAIITLQYTIDAHDSISLIVVGVTNPTTAQTVSDFKVSTTGDPVNATAPAYPIGVNGSPGVVVTVNPATAGSTATYTISNIHASATLTGGSGTIELEAPSGTVFPNNSTYYTVSDSTTSSGSGTVTAPLSGGGSPSVTLTVPNTINIGDVLALTIEDVINPSTSSSTDSITLVGNVTGPVAVAPTTTTTSTTQPTTTTTKPKPVIEALTSSAAVTGGGVHVNLECKVQACTGTVTLTDVVTEVATANYHASSGQTISVHLTINKTGMGYIEGAKGHTIKVWDTITVNGGSTTRVRLVLIGPAAPVIDVLTSSAAVTGGIVYLEFGCRVQACSGTITLTDVATKVAGANYHASTGQTFSVHLGVNKTGMGYLKGAKDHTIEVWDTITVNGGNTTRDRLVLKLA